MTSKNKAVRRAVINSVVLIIFCVFSSQLFATFWVLILPFSFFVVAFFVVAAIKNIRFWIKNRVGVSHPWLPAFIQGFAVLVTFLVPSHERSKQYYLRTFRLADNRKTGCPCNLYLEYYSVFNQGAFGTGLNAEYLTDSIHFRKFVGVYDDGGMPIKVTCHNDTIETEKTDEDYSIERKTYSLKNLKSEKVFE